jgi:hypothetical protein
MATYEHCKLGDVALLRDGDYGFNICNQRGSPLVSFAYPTEADAKAAHSAIAEGLANASAVTIPGT